MSYTVLCGALVTLLVVRGAIAWLSWWIRQPSHRPRAYRGIPLPLFSHARAAVWLRKGDEPDEDEDGTAT
jgi:hypothetical protein